MAKLPYLRFMNLESTIARVEAYIRTSGMAASTVSRLVFKDGKRLRRLKETGNCTLGLIERANATLDQLEATHSPESPASSVEPAVRSAGTPAPSREGAQVASPGT